MKIIQSLSDIELLKTSNEIPTEFVKEIEQDFLNIYEAENDEVYLLNFRLPLSQALFILEKGDGVLEKLNNPFELEYVERLEVNKCTYYRCALFKGSDMQLYYSLVNIHDGNTEKWLLEQTEWNNGIGDFDV